MQTRTRNALTLAVVALLTSAGLSAIARRRKPLELGARALDAIPNGALLVATADLVALRASPVGAPFLREGREIKGLGKVRDVCGFDPVDTLTEVAIAIPAAGETGDFGLVASGPIDEQALLACASKVIEARGGHATTVTIGSFRSVRDTSLAEGGGEIAVRKGGPLLLGGGAYLRAMIDAADGRGATIRSSPSHGMLARAIGDAPVRVTVVLTPEQRKVLADELESGGAAGDPAGSIRAAAVGVTLGTNVAVHAVLSCETAPACAAVAERLSEARDVRSKDIALRLVGVGAVLERLVIAARGDQIDARVEMPAGEAATLLDRIITLRGVRHPMPEEGRPRRPREDSRAAPPVKPDEVVTLDAGAPAPKAPPAALSVTSSGPRPPPPPR